MPDRPGPSETCQRTERRENRVVRRLLDGAVRGGELVEEVGLDPLELLARLGPLLVVAEPMFIPTCFLTFGSLLANF